MPITGHYEAIPRPPFYHRKCGRRHRRRRRVLGKRKRKACGRWVGAGTAGPSRQCQRLSLGLLDPKQYRPLSAIQILMGLNRSQLVYAIQTMMGLQSCYGS